MKVGAYQAPLTPLGSMAAIEHIRRHVACCEAEGVAILCCPEAILGGLADDVADAAAIALDVDSGELAAALAPLASDTVTTLVGFTERCGDALYNSVAVFERGEVRGVYRKHHPAIRRSIYRAGDRASVFTVGALTFGIIICYDSAFDEPAAQLAGQGAAVLFVPSHNALPPHKADIVDEARAADVGHATRLGVWVVRADVAGRCGARVSHGASGIVEPDGSVQQTSQPFAEQLLIADIGPASAMETAPGSSRPQWEACGLTRRPRQGLR